MPDAELLFAVRIDDQMTFEQARALAEKLRERGRLERVDWPDGEDARYEVAVRVVDAVGAVEIPLEWARFAVDLEGAMTADDDQARVLWAVALERWWAETRQMVEELGATIAGRPYPQVTR